MERSPSTLYITSFLLHFFLRWQSNHNIIKACRRPLTQRANFLCKLSEKNCCCFAIERLSSAGHLLLKPGVAAKAHDLTKFSRRETTEREDGEKCIFPSCCTTLAWFQVLNCYFNMTTSHVLHHLHRTPSTYPARLSVGPRCGAVETFAEHVRALGARAQNMKRKTIAKNIALTLLAFSMHGNFYCGFASLEGIVSIEELKIAF